jgi:hypothetical protein
MQIYWTKVSAIPSSDGSQNVRLVSSVEEVAMKHAFTGVATVVLVIEGTVVMTHMSSAAASAPVAEPTCRIQILALGHRRAWTEGVSHERH